MRPWRNHIMQKKKREKPGCTLAGKIRDIVLTCFYFFHYSFSVFLILCLSSLSVFSQVYPPAKALSPEFIEKFNKGRDYFTLNQTALALPVFQELYKKQPYNSNLNYLLGICYTEEEPQSSKSIFHLEKAIKDVSTDYDASSFSEKRTPIFVFYYLTIAYSQNGRCDQAAQAKNYFHSLYGMEKNDYYISDAERWVKKCREHGGVPGTSSFKTFNTEDSLITKNVDYTTSMPLYGVQVGAYSRLVPVYEFIGLKNVNAFIDKQGTVRYVIGHFGFKEQAESLLEIVAEAGYRDAFIVDVNKEMKFSEELIIVNNTSLYKNNIEKPVFKVQIGAFRETIPSEIAKIYLQLEGIEERIENGITCLFAGNFNSYEDAEKKKTAIMEIGIHDAFIVAYSGNKKIDVKLARGFYKK